jgi:hypothetical protein
MSSDKGRMIGIVSQDKVMLQDYYVREVLLLAGQEGGAAPRTA